MKLFLNKAVLGPRQFKFGQFKFLKNKKIGHN